MPAGRTVPTVTLAMLASWLLFATVPFWIERVGLYQYLGVEILIFAIYALAFNNRGYVYEAQGRKDDAIADFQAALLLDPSLVGARDGLKRLGAPAAWLAESDRRVQAGKALVEKNCSGCHAVGAKGASANAKAPEFRNLHARHPSLALREPLSRGIAAPHDEMPKFTLSGAEIDSIVAYINSHAGRRELGPQRQEGDADIG